MIDIDRLDRQLELALTPDLRAQLKPRAGSPEPATSAVEHEPEPAPAPPARPARALAPLESPNGLLALPPGARPMPRRHRRHPTRPALPLHPTSDVAPEQSGGTESTGLGYHARQIVEMVASGRMGEADRHIAAHASLAEEGGTLADERDAAAWSTMRALLDGRQADARSGARKVLALGQESGDPGAEQRYRTQQFWIVLQWGDEDERYELLDYCRQQAYRNDDVTWRSALTLLLARMGKTAEAEREFDATSAAALKLRPSDPPAVDITTNLAEAAALLGSPRRASAVNRAEAWPAAGLGTVGGADVCKGSFARFRALLAAATGRWPEADNQFQAAVEVHRRLEAGPLLARALEEWGLSLSGRNDPRAYGCLEESSELARRLELVELVPGG